MGSALGAVAVELPRRTEHFVRRAAPGPTPEEPVGHWGVIQTYATQEQYAVRNLRNQGFDAFCPLEGRPKRGDPLTSVLVPLFPCYAFVLIEPDRQWRSINSTYGVIRLLTDRSREVPTPLFADDVDARVSEALKKLRESAVEPFAPGTVVRVLSGPFTSFLGTVREMDKNMRVMVMLSMFSRDTEVRFDDPRDLEVVQE